MTATIHNGCHFTFACLSLFVLLVFLSLLQKIKTSPLQKIEIVQDKRLRTQFSSQKNQASLGYTADWRCESTERSDIGCTENIEMIHKITMESPSRSTAHKSSNHTKVCRLFYVSAGSAWTAVVIDWKIPADLRHAFSNEQTVLIAFLVLLRIPGFGD